MTNRVHPTAIVGQRVELGEGNIIGPYSVIADGTKMGSYNWVGSHVVLGSPPEHRTVLHMAEWIDGGEGLAAGVEIGSHCVIREFTAVQRGISGPTQIGSRCFIMDKVHVAHDCKIGDFVTLAPGVAFGGHTDVGTGANVGINASTHQFAQIGPGAMIGMGAVVLKDVTGLSVVAGVPARLLGANRVGMERLGFGAGDVNRMHEALRDIEHPNASATISELTDAYVKKMAMKGESRVQ